MTVFDHLFAFVLAVVVPISGALSFQRLLRRVEAGDTIDRIALYKATFATQWILFLLLAVLWFGNDRSWSALGFDAQFDLWLLLAIGLTAAGIAVLILQLRQISATDNDEIRTLRNSLGRVAIIIPQNGNELGRFYGLSVTAGIVEETLWRGFMIWYLANLMPMWAAALLSILGFGIAHAYQGVRQLPKITLLGAAFTGLFFLSGSLVLPILLHAAVDILQGRTGYEILRHRADERDATEDDKVPGSTA